MQGKMDKYNSNNIWETFWSDIVKDKHVHK